MKIPNITHKFGIILIIGWIDVNDDIMLCLIKMKVSCSKPYVGIILRKVILKIWPVDMAIKHKLIIGTAIKIGESCIIRIFGGVILELYINAIWINRIEYIDEKIAAKHPEKYAKKPSSVCCI
jgi:hypothetical protein